MGKTKRRASKRLRIKGVSDAETEMHRASSKLLRMLQHSPAKDHKPGGVNPKRLAENLVDLGDFYTSKEDYDSATGAYGKAQRAVKFGDLEGFDDLDSKYQSAWRRSNPEPSKKLYGFGIVSLLGGALLAVGGVTGNAIGVNEVSYAGGALFLVGLALLGVGFYRKLSYPVIISQR